MEMQICRKAVELLSDLVFHSTLDPVELEKEKGVVLEEIAMVMDENPNTIKSRLYRTLKELQVKMA